MFRFKGIADKLLAYFYPLTLHDFQKFTFNATGDLAAANAADY